jgi:hypothetical protein
MLCIKSFIDKVYVRVKAQYSTVVKEPFATLVQGILREYNLDTLKVGGVDRFGTVFVFNQLM